MTRPIFEPSLQRTDARLGYGSNQLFRRPAPSSGGGDFPILFRAALQVVDDPEADRIHYSSGDGGDDIYWDYWDTTFDTSVYSIAAYDFTDPLTGRPMIAGVGLLQTGFYAILSTIDLGQYFNGVTQMQSNFDDGVATYAELYNSPSTPDNTFTGDFMGPRLDHFRHLPDNFDVFGSESDVEIVFCQNNNADITFYGTNGVGPGTQPLSGGTPGVVTPDSDVWVPGGYDGAWGNVPQMVVAYWGVTTSEGFDPDWPDVTKFEHP